MESIARRTALGSLLAGLCAPAFAAFPAEPDFDDDGYRARRYRAPVDRLPRPARRITLGDALALQPARDAMFVDVLPVEAGYRDTATGIWRLSQLHETVPGALWHPEAGRSPVDPVLWHGLRDAVAVARRQRPRLPVIMFCRTDCWMGWNAARRLARAGTRHVFWFAEGIEGWYGAGRELEPVAPAAIAAPP